MAAYTNALHTHAHTQCTAHSMAGPHVTIAQRVHVPRFYRQLGCRIFRGGGGIGDVRFVRVFDFFFSFSPTISSIFLPLFFTFSYLFFFLSLFFFPSPFSVPHIAINNLSKAVNREIDRRSSRKLLLYGVFDWKFCLYAYREICLSEEHVFAAQCSSVWHARKSRRGNWTNLVGGAQGAAGGKIEIAQPRALLVLQRGFACDSIFFLSPFFFFSFIYLFIYFRRDARNLSNLFENVWKNSF